VAIPDMRAYQQIPLGGKTGPYDCTAWSAAILVDAHTRGAIKLRGQDIRKATDEPVPSSGSPGLNLPQVDAAVLELSGNKVDLDTRVSGSEILTREQARARAADGRWFGIQLIRGVLIDRGVISGGFRGPHCITGHMRMSDKVAILGDPLVPKYLPSAWDALFDAAEAFADGRLLTQWTRDITPDYRVRIVPSLDGATVKAFYRYRVDASGRITSRALDHTSGIVRRCSPPRYRSAAQGKPAIWSRQLVTITEGRRSGWIVDAQFAKEIST